jgi:hypothetical protein
MSGKLRGHIGGAGVLSPILSFITPFYFFSNYPYKPDKILENLSWHGFPLSGCQNLFPTFPRPLPRQSMA